MELKSLKKDLEKIFARIQQSTEQGELPSETDVNTFSRLARQMQIYAQDEWADECEDFQYLATQLLHSVKKGQVQDAIRLVDSLDDARTYCHRTFK